MTQCTGRRVSAAERRLLRGRRAHLMAGAGEQAHHDLGTLGVVGDDEDVPRARRDLPSSSGRGQSWTVSRAPAASCSPRSIASSRCIEMSATRTSLSSTPGALHAVVQHDVAERARGGDSRRSGGDRLWARSSFTFLPMLSSIHMRAPPAPQHMPSRAVAAHLDDLDALERADHLAGREVHVVVAAEVARVVVGDALLERAFVTVEAARSRCSHSRSWLWCTHLVVAAELRVLVQQRVEAVRALRDDLAARPCR